jgi:general secretion pathway protein C
MDAHSGAPVVFNPLEPLILTGTVASPDSRNSRAFIGIDARNAQTYLQGAVLADGERLVLILPDRVVLSDGHHRRELPIGGALRVPQEIAHGASLASAGMADRGGARETANSDAFTDDIRPNPVFEGDSLRGYEVYPGRRPDAFYRLRLQGGDVITSINGQSMSDPPVAMELFRRLTASSAASVTVLRKGQPIELTLSGPSAVEAARLGAQQASTQE